MILTDEPSFSGSLRSARGLGGPLRCSLLDSWDQAIELGRIEFDESWLRFVLDDFRWLKRAEVGPR